MGLAARGKASPAPGVRSRARGGCRQWTVLAATDCIIPDRRAVWQFLLPACGHRQPPDNPHHRQMPGFLKWKTTLPVAKRPNRLPSGRLAPKWAVAKRLHSDRPKSDWEGPPRRAGCSPFAGDHGCAAVPGRQWCWLARRPKKGSTAAAVSSPRAMWTTFPPPWPPASDACASGRCVKK